MILPRKTKTYTLAICTGSSATCRHYFCEYPYLQCPLYVRMFEMVYVSCVAPTVVYVGTLSVLIL